MKIGLEVHVQLTTKTKLFCGCPNKFSNEPNIYVCDYCLGFPGSKPRINSRAFEYAMKIALALNCSVPDETFFSRKSYFYPDMGKNFQITQFEIPVAKEGYVKISDHPLRKIRIRRIQMEEDPARLVHAGTITKAEYVLADYNRSGVPLCEIVTEPDIESSKEARIFLQELSSILEYLGIYDPRIEGSMRVDSNISVGEVRVEIKNISGFKDVEKALNYEIIRQKNLLKRGGHVLMETRGWDADAGVTRSLRLKEGEEEYGYIFEPDLPRLTISQELIENIKDSLPEFAHEKVARYEKLGIETNLAVSITSEPDLAEIFEKVVNNINPKLAASWFAGEIKKTLNYNNLRIKETGLTAEHLTKLLKMIENKELTERSAELLLREMVVRPVDPEFAAKKSRRIYDEKVIDEVIEEIVAENTKAIIDYKAGKKESFNFLVGQVMRKTQGRGDPDTIRKVLKRKLGG